MEYLNNLKNESLKLELDIKYNLIFEVSKEENSLLIHNRNNNDYLLIAILEDEDDKNELRVYTDDEYLIIKKENIINFLIDYLSDYFKFL